MEFNIKIEEEADRNKKMSHYSSADDVYFFYF